MKDGIAFKKDAWLRKSKLLAHFKVV